ncbi:MULTISPECIES: common pilus major fimbrillin subunit EcpA [Aeromonas]|uniref:common pilus major fimbrillin subunit EcpA n=1 Tax=Aeromonas TaxID=642 RepID=UPI000DDB7369|nr:MULTISPECIES: common pilus major fimbrillin subunit EcpA [Aeromonas]AXB00701.1 fimbrial protein [Aeromonas caviae]QLL78915.1 fimbrial protein [Aeromonas caviae]QXB99996.1 common pilus major fimbrillin subunit EcpA [Aeromonas sp. FDAARGOS 1418]UBS65533.1 common pilus major fimbrillin subunit EcpA [Aeromonas caviae]WKS85000.1 common pilus major fimbrillin subunit EcpA [Aeromonas caviae]
MKKTLIALTVAGLGFAATAHAAVEASAVATWQATAKKDTTSELIVTPLSSLSFQYAEGIKGFNTVNGLFDVSIKGDASATSFTLKAKKLNGTLNHLSGDSTVDVGVLWGGAPVGTTAYTTLIDTAAGITGGNISPLANGFQNDAQRTTAQGSFTFNIESATANGSSTTFDALPDGLWSGEVNVEFVANWV